MPEAWSPADAELVALLAEIAPQLDAPRAAHLPERVRARIAAPPALDRPVRRAPRWRAVAAGLAVLALVAVGVVATPSARRAVADLLGIGAVGIEYADGPPAATANRLDLGERVDLAGASEAAGFRVVRPRALGAPSAVYVRRVGRWREVSLVWPPDDRLPRTPATGVGLLLTEIRGGFEVSYLKQLVVEGTDVEAVTVDGARGYWISGAPHTLVAVAPDGAVVPTRARLAGDVLVWERGGVTYRVESALGRAESLRIAASLP